MRNETSTKGASCETYRRRQVVRELEHRSGVQTRIFDLKGEHAQMALDQCAQAKALVQLARQQQPGVGSHRRAAELDPKLGIEREANRASFCVTHWVVPSAPARSPREPRFMRALSNYRPVCSPFKSKIRAKR